MTTWVTEAFSRIAKTDEDMQIFEDLDAAVKRHSKPSFILARVRLIRASGEIFIRDQKLKSHFDSLASELRVALSDDLLEHPEQARLLLENARAMAAAPAA